jgi:hypothetical protein
VADPNLEGYIDREQNRFYGLYLGSVAETYSGERGELVVSVPQVFGPDLVRNARPATPFAGSAQGFFAMPEKGTRVWVAFEAGDPSFPVWIGCLWGDHDLTGADNDPKVKFFKTAKFTLRIDDSLGEVEISNANGCKITLGSVGIQIEGASLKFKTKGGREVSLDAPGVDINQGGATFL